MTMTTENNDQRYIERLRSERAIFSGNRRYRYALTRGSLLLGYGGANWEVAEQAGGIGPEVRFMSSVRQSYARRYCAFCLLNPSTADEHANDATVRKCIGFAKRWDFNGVDIVNLFALRATFPGDLYHESDPIGPDNNGWIMAICRSATLVVLGWGNHGDLLGRGQQVRATLQAAGISLHCLKINKNEQLGHPLYLSFRTPLQAVPLRGLA